MVLRRVAVLAPWTTPTHCKEISIFSGVIVYITLYLQCKRYHLKKYILHITLQNIVVFNFDDRGDVSVTNLLFKKPGFY